jgi:serine O-acetyltransferase
VTEPVVTRDKKRRGRRLAEDIRTVRLKDPAATSTAEVLLYPHMHALWLHHLAHRAYLRGHRLRARALALLGRFVSGGIDIHPGATIGRRLFIDHGVGVVIGETAVIGDDVMLYHGVTVGSAGWWRDRAGTRRHPVVGDHVRLCTGASVLGPVIVGAGSEIGAHAVVLTDLPPGSRVAAGTVVRPAGLPGTRINGSVNTSLGGNNDHV